MIQPSRNIKEDLEKYTDKATILIHAPETRGSVLAALDGADPVQRVANAGVLVMQRLDTAARQTGIEVQDSVKVIGAYKIVELIAEIAEAARKFTLAKPLIELALSVTVQDYVKAEMNAKRIDGKKLRVAMEADVRTLPPKLRKQVQQSPLRLQQIARRYNHGKGINLFRDHE